MAQWWSDYWCSATATMIKELTKMKSRPDFEATASGGCCL